MPRAVKDAPLTTKAARERLAVQHKPYWRGFGAGAALGYRKGITGGVWLVRVADPAAGGGYRQASIGKADDTLRATGNAVLDYRQAETKARDWIADRHRLAAGPEQPVILTAPYNVTDALTDYLADYAARGGKALQTTRQAVNAHILPVLGDAIVSKLTREQLKRWHRDLAASPARLRSKPGADKRYRDPSADVDAGRRRQASANRVLTILKAALNHARHEGKAACPDDAWSAVKAFREADKAKVRYLQEGEITRLVNACPPDFRELVVAALLTGCRYGELAALTAGDFDPRARTIRIGRSKGGQPRQVALTDEGNAFFDQASAGKTATEPLLQRDWIVKQATRAKPAETKRVGWSKSAQIRPMRETCAAAKIEPVISFHDLRHTYASRLAMRGVPMGVIAAQLGHADTRMTERHYAHLAPSYVADTVRQAFGTLGIVGETAVRAIGIKPTAA